MQSYKILICGPVEAGKTTAIAALSDTPPITTEAAARVRSPQRKPMTTVAMDYGAVELEDELSIRLYGTPGLERFDFMYRILWSHTPATSWTISATGWPAFSRCSRLSGLLLSRRTGFPLRR